MQRTTLSVCCRSVCTDAKYLSLNATRSRIFLAQGFSITSLEDLPCNFLGNHLNLSIYLNLIFFFPLPYGNSSLFNFIEHFLQCLWPKPIGWSALSSLWNKCLSHRWKMQAWQDVRHLRERMLIQRKMVGNTSLLFLCHLEGLPRKLPHRAYCSGLQVQFFLASARNRKMNVVMSWNKLQHDTMSQQLYTWMKGRKRSFVTMRQRFI